MRISTGHNSTFKLAVQWLNEALCFVSSSVVADSFVLRNRQLLVAAKRYQIKPELPKLASAANSQKQKAKSRLKCFFPIQTASCFSIVRIWLQVQPVLLGLLLKFFPFG